MNFSAEKTATFDDKGRVVLPADYKNGMGGCVPGGQLAIELDPYEKCINIYPMEVWEQRLEQITLRLNPNDQKDSRLLDMFYRMFKVVQVPAATNRMNFPNNFLEKVGIEKDVVFVGQGNRIRLWDVKVYEEYINSMGDYAELFGQAFGGSNRM
ncbi:MAG: division/cell wall cluster transcriptional repressor MraZ [Mangrovibacterium sp.]